MARVLPASFFPDTCTIQSRTDTQTATGYPEPTWANVTGLVNITCRLERMKETSFFRRDGTFAFVEHQIVLRGYYPTITEDMRAVTQGDTWLILGVTHEAVRTCTVLQVRVIRV